LRVLLYGLVIDLTFPLAWPLVRDATGSARRPDLTIELVHEPPVRPGEPRAAHPSDPDPVADGWSLHRYGEDALLVVGFPEDADYYLWEDRIVCHLLEPSARFIIDTQLLGTVLAVWLERRGTVALHAAAAVVADRAVAFTAVPGGGKTTSATAIASAGHALLADDLLALEPAGQDVLVHPGYPMLRLWPDQVERFIGDPSPFPRVHPRFEKRRIDLAGSPLAFSPRPAPIAEIHVPTPDDVDSVTFEPLSSSQALVALLGSGFLDPATNAVARPRQRLAQLASIVDRAPVSRVRFPAGLDRIDQLVTAVTQRLTGSPSGSPHPGRAHRAPTGHPPSGDG